MKTLTIFLAVLLILVLIVPVYSDFPVRSSNNSEVAPVVVYNSKDKEYLVVWSENTVAGGIYMIGPIMGQRFNEDGSKKGSAFTIFNLGDSPAAAYNSQANDYFVVCEASGVKGKIVKGTVIGPERDLARNGDYPEIVYNTLANEYLLLYYKLNVNPKAVYSRRIHPNGITSASPPEDTHVGDDITFSVAYAPLTSSQAPKGKYVVAHHPELSYIVLDSEGKYMDHFSIQAGNSSKTGLSYYDDGHVDIAFGYNNYDRFSYKGPVFVVVWGDLDNFWPWDGAQQVIGAWCTFINANDYTSLGDIYYEAMPVDDGSYWRQHDQGLLPQVDYCQAAKKFIVVWRESPSNHPSNTLKVKHIRATSSLTSFTPPDVVLSATTGNEDPATPAFAASSNSASALVVWRDSRNFSSKDWDLYGNIFTTAAAPSKPNLILESGTRPFNCPTLTIDVTIKNHLAGTNAGNSTLGYYLSLDQNITTSDILLGTDNVPALAGGATSNQSITISDICSKSGVSNGTWWVGVIIDKDNVVNEGKEDDNAVVLPPAITVTCCGGGNNTNTGTNVQVNPSSDVTVTFDNVTTAGNTSVNKKNSGSPPPSGFTIIPSSSPVYYDINTTAIFSGNIKICIKYNDAGMTPAQESSLKLQVYEVPPGSWKDITTSLDVNTNTICGMVNHLTDFAIMSPTGGSTRQTISLPQGWSWISFNVQPSDLSVEQIFSGVSNLAIVVNNNGEFYMPGVVNSIGQIDILEGYKVYVTTPGQVSVTGQPVTATTPINLTAGWNFVSYLPNTNKPVETALASIVSELAIVQNDDGNFFIPSVVNSLGNMKSGEGYKMYLNSTVTLTYPSGLTVLKSSLVTPITKKQRPSHFQFKSHTGESFSVVVKALNIGEKNPELGDEVGIFTADGLCVGASVWDGTGVMAVATWKDENQTDQIDGFRENEVMYFKFWEDDKELELDLQPVFIVGNNKFGDGVFCQVELSGSSIVKHYSLEQNYPNPFNAQTNISYFLCKPEKVVIKVYSLLGEQITTLVNERKESGSYTVLWDGKNDLAKDVPSGVYIYQLSAGSYTTIKKAILIK